MKVLASGVIGMAIEEPFLFYICGKEDVDQK